MRRKCAISSDCHLFQSQGEDLMKTLLTACAVAAISASSASAAIIGVTGDVVQIAQPATVTNATPGDDKIALAFDELQVVQLLADLATDTGLIAAGTWISSHMILLNHEEESGVFNASGNVSFDGTVIGTMSDIDGALLTASDFLGAPTTYTSFDNRGLESNDSLTIVPLNSVNFTFNATEPGDWVRVITEAPAPVPVPAAGLLLVLGLGALGAAGRKKKA